LALCLDRRHLCEGLQGGRIVSVTIAVGVNNDGRREGLNMAVGCSEAKIFWTDFLRKKARRGLRRVNLAISDAHEGLKAANATWQRYQEHFMRNQLVHVGRNCRKLAASFIGAIFAQEDKAATKAQWPKVADQTRPGLLKLAAF
jgi:putative transposase